MTRTTPAAGAGKPKLAVYKFSSCDGCQLSLLNLEDELLELVGAVEVAYFLEARRRELPPPYEIGLVEGSVSTPEEEERIHRVRRDCRFLVAIGRMRHPAVSRPPQLGGRGGVHAYGVRAPGVHQDPRHSDAHRGSCLCGLRAGGLPRESGSTAGAAGGDAGRA